MTITYTSREQQRREMEEHDRAYRKVLHDMDIKKGIEISDIYQTKKSSFYLYNHRMPDYNEMVEIMNQSIRLQRIIEDTERRIA